MFSIKIILFILIIFKTIYAKKNFINDLLEANLKFPKYFQFGAASAAYQVEGAWNESGKGENIWDHIIHTNPSFIYNNETGDVACDSYHKYKEDIQLLKYIGFDVYRFSISWSRILPKGTKDVINKAGINYYNKLIDGLLDRNIQPMVTMYHWDLPQPLQEIGGWLNSSIVDYFEDYATLLFSTYGDRVKLWITINEPISITQGYGATVNAPALDLHGIGDYLCGHNLLKAHARAYHVYKNKFKRKQKGKISFALDGGFGIPMNNTIESYMAAERYNQFTLGWFSHPVYSSSGDYAPLMRQYIDWNSASEGRNESRLPYFTFDEVNYIRGTYDFLALNHYSSVLVKTGVSWPKPSPMWDANVELAVDPKWPSSESPWLKVVPEGLRKALNWLRIKYNNPIIFITENGFSDYNETEDFQRIIYHQSYLKSLSDAIYEDNCNVIGYTVWSILDNFEWRAGYSQRFGIVQVDFNDPKRPRKLKTSAEYFRKLIAQHKKKVQRNI
ncbi:hypothetical protein O3M35_000277 [Rhynocoris fuscipes]|uniref:beta-glucosidase n=1 Tax=Rhynocoris fuscipes TaxID=488301 RepID=A0AAW1DM13_9HEMI